MLRKHHSKDKRRWIFQRVGSIPLAAAVIVHAWLFVFGPGRTPDPERLRQIFSQPEWLAFYILFTALALYHGLSGVWTLMTDRNPSATYKRNLRIILRAAGLVLMAFAVWTFVRLGLS